MTSLMLRTLSSSFCKALVRACSVSYFDSVLRWGGALVLSEALAVGVLVGFEVREGDAKRSSASDESERSSLAISGVAIAW